MRNRRKPTFFIERVSQNVHLLATPSQYSTSNHTAYKFERIQLSQRANACACIRIEFVVISYTAYAENLKSLRSKSYTPAKGGFLEQSEALPILNLRGNCLCDLQLSEFNADLSRFGAFFTSILSISSHMGTRVKSRVLSFGSLGSCSKSSSVNASKHPTRLSKCPFTGESCSLTACDDTDGTITKVTQASAHNREHSIL